MFTRQARKDAQKVAASGLRTNVERLLQVLREDFWRSPPPFEKLIGDLIAECVIAMHPAIVAHTD